MAQFTWFNLVTSSLILIAIYFLLLLASRLLPLANKWGHIADTLQGVIKILMLVFEPVTLVLITGYFILINPIYNGVVMAIILLVGFNHLRNYFNGRIVLLMNRIRVGQKVQVGKAQGIITEMNRLGIQLKTSKGLRTIGYTSLFQDDFMLMSGDDVGGYYYMNIQPIDPVEAKNSSDKIYDLLATAPYLDHSHALVLLNLENGELGVKTRVIVKEESHLKDLLSLFKEQGYECEISKK